MFWENFYELCAGKNMKPNSVAQELGIASGTVSKWKNEGAVPNGETLIKIADYFDVSVDYLLGRTDIPAVNKSDPTEYTVLSAASGKAVDSKTVKLTKEQIETMKSIIDKISE